jgi:SOS-response transcriptional repressor LexA
LPIEGGQRMLQALNPDRPKRITPIHGNCSIGGGVMGKVASFI